MFEAFYNSLKPIQLINYMHLGILGKFPNGTTEVPFEIPLKGKGGKQLYEIYHGVFVCVMYSMRCDMKRSLLSRDIQKVVEFIVECKSNSTTEDGEKRVDFTVNPESLQESYRSLVCQSFWSLGTLTQLTVSLQSHSLER